jgi:hypothetical protein
MRDYIEKYKKRARVLIDFCYKITFLKSVTSDSNHPVYDIRFIGLSDL